MTVDKVPFDEQDLVDLRRENDRLRSECEWLAGRLTSGEGETLKLKLKLEDIRRVDIKPGEILGVTLPPGVDAEYVQRVHAYLTATLPDVKILVMSAGVDLQVLCPSSPASPVAD